MKQKLLLLFAIFTTLAANAVKIGKFYYDLDETSSTATITGYVGGASAAHGVLDILASVEYEDKQYTVTSIGSAAFFGYSGMTYVGIPGTITRIGDYAFDYCSGLTSVSIPGSVTSIGEYAFKHCTGLTSVKIPNSVTSIGSYALDSCSELTSVTIGNSVTSIGSFAFRGCEKLSSVTIGNSVTSIGKCAFNGCSSLLSLTLPNSIMSIGDYAFDFCESLTTVVIGYSIASIGESAFYGCFALNSVTCLAMTPPTIYQNTFHAATYDKANLYVPQSSVNNYEYNAMWKLYHNIIGVDPSGIDDVQSDGCTDSNVRVEGGNIVAPEGSKVYDLSGRRVRPEGLSRGIYIVRIPGGKAVKILL